MQSRQILFFLILVAGAFANPVDGLFSFDDSRTGTAVLQFLKLPVGGRAVAMGGNLSAIDDQATTMYWNPAGLSEVDRYTSSISHAEVLGEWRHEFLSGVIPLSSGALGFSTNALYTTPVEYARDINEDPSEFLALDLGFSVAYGRELIPGVLSGGAKLSWLNSRLDEYLGNGYSVDLGLRWNLIHGLVSSLTLENLSHGFSYNSGTNTVEDLPTTSSFSMGLPRRDGAWSWQVGYTKTNDGSQKAGFGLEYLLRELLFFRGGWEHSLQDRETGWSDGLSLGTGLQINSISLDYGVRLLGDLGQYHALTLSFAARDKAQRNKSWLEKAREAYADGQCPDAATHARRALREEPGQLEAIAMIQQCRKFDLAKSGHRITVLFTGGSQGRIGPNWDSGNPIGGMARRKSALRSLLAVYPEAIVLDAGHNTSEKDIGLSALPWIATSLNQMDYTGIFRSPEDKKLLQDPVGKSLPWIGESGLLWIKDKLEVVVSIQAETTAKKPGTLRVLILDGTLEEASRVSAGAYPPDLIILAGKMSPLPQPLSFGKTRVVSVGRGGNHVGRISFFLDEKGEISSFDHGLVELGSSIAADPQLDKILEKVVLHLETSRNEAPVLPGTYSALLMLLPVAGGGSDIYLNDPVKDFQVRLTKRPANYRDVDFAHTRNEILYTKEIPQGRGMGKRGLYLQPTNSKDAILLSDSAETVLQARWGPYENWAYFISTSTGERPELFRITPRGYERSNLGGYRYARIVDFDVAVMRNFIAILAGEEGKESVWHGRAGGVAPVRLSPKGSRALMPRYSPDARKLAFLLENTDPSLEKKMQLAVHDFLRDTLFVVDLAPHVTDISWSRDGKTIRYSAGVNITDLNALDLETLESRRITEQKEDGTVRSESDPRPYRYNTRDGILYQEKGKKGVSLKWIPLEGGKSIPIPGKGVLAN